MSNIIQTARLIEVRLYKDAESFADYLDVSTLPQRFTMVKFKLKGSCTRKSDETIDQLSNKFDLQCNFKGILLNESWEVTFRINVLRFHFQVYMLKKLKQYNRTKDNDRIVNEIHRTLIVIFLYNYIFRLEV